MTGLVCIACKLEKKRELCGLNFCVLENDGIGVCGISENIGIERLGELCNLELAVVSRVVGGGVVLGVVSIEVRFFALGIH